MDISDVLIHVRESLNPEQRQALEESVRQVEGVVAPRFNPGRDHLLLVAFNPERVGTETLLGKVRGAGYDARLIGA